jgi:hypothetical protein
MQGEERRQSNIGRWARWRYYLSVFLPAVLLIALAVVFSGSSSSSSDCGSGSDCSSSSGANLTGVCGAPANLDKSGSIRPVFSMSIKSGNTDMRCGYGLSWSYDWTKAKKTPTKPNVTISVSAPKGGISKANTADTLGDHGWAGTYNVMKGTIGGSSPIPGTITVTASYTPSGFSGLFDSVNVSLHLVYYPVKK